MQFTQAFLAALSAAAAQAVIITNVDFSTIAVGVPFTITYAEAVGAVTVYLGSGTPANVIQGDAIGTSSGTTGSITWTPASGGSFALKIVDAGAPNSPTNPNFSGFFPVAGPVSGSTTTAATTGVSTTTPAGVSSSTTPVLTTTPVISSNTTMTRMSTTTPAGNTTVTRTSMSTGGSSSSSESTTAPTQVPNSMASGFASPLAFVFLAVGALLTLN